MFIGYQLKKVGEELKTVEGEDGVLTSVVVDITEPFISYIAETREELESMPCITFDRIEETDKEYFLHNGEYVYELPVPTMEEQIMARQEAYKTEVDPITCHIQRLGDEEQTPETIAEIAALVEERKAKVEEIKARYPYPVVEKPLVEPELVSEEPFVELNEASEDIVELYSMEI